MLGIVAMSVIETIVTWLIMFLIATALALVLLPLFIAVSLRFARQPLLGIVPVEDAGDDAMPEAWRQIIRTAEFMGFLPAGQFELAGASKGRARLAFFLIDDGHTLLWVEPALRRVMLISALDCGRWITTSNVHYFVNLSGLEDEQVLRGAGLVALLSHHRQRLERRNEPVVPFAADTLPQTLLAFWRRTAERNAELGLAYFGSPARDVWRFTWRGAIRTTLAAMRRSSWGLRGRPDGTAGSAESIPRPLWRRTLRWSGLVLCTVLFIAINVLAVRSAGHEEHWTYWRNDPPSADTGLGDLHHWELGVSDGHLWIEWGVTAMQRASPPSWEHSRDPIDIGQSKTSAATSVSSHDEPGLRCRHFLGVHVHYLSCQPLTPTFEPQWHTWEITIPMWTLATLMGAWPFVVFARWVIRRGWRNPRLCSKCGYDLRATPDPAGPLLERCPECGHTTPKPVELMGPSSNRSNSD